MVSDSELTDFKKNVIEYYVRNYRPFPWRETPDPYAILVSEIMLQQTQTERVVPKYLAFLDQFPTINSLASSGLSDVLTRWQGLGYNRRARFLRDSAQKIMSEFNGVFPQTVDEIDSLPGVGYATACAVLTYSFNMPTAFIETNIRTVFIHHFFPDRTDVHDKEILPLIERSVDPLSPRDWYYALMDYGVMLKKTIGNMSRRSAHYATQSRFEGSDRQLRSKILRHILKNGIAQKTDVYIAFDSQCDRIDRLLDTLVKDSLLIHNDGTYEITK